MDPHHFGLPLQLPASAFASFHPPLPVDQRTHEGRYVWDNSAAAAAHAARMHAYHHHPSAATVAAHGIPGNNAASPSLSELQYSAQRRSSAAAAMMNGSASAADVHAYRLSPYVDLYGYPNPNLRGLSPVDTRGIPMHPDYMTGLGHRSVMSDMHGNMAPSTIGSELPFSMDGSRLTTPRSGIRQGRKRALSSSPYSDLDLMIRHSPNSLLNISLMNGSRSGSSASGSYGHLSAGAISPALGVHSVVPQFQQLQHLIRQGTIPGSSFLSHGSLMHQSAGLTASQQSLLMSQQQSQVDQMLGKDHLTHPIVHPSMHPQTDQRKTTKVKKEPLGINCSDSKSIEGGNQTADPMKDEPGDFVETNCHWEDCENEFTTQEELVKHINNDHIHVNKKSFVCRWKECSRGQKPFKAQYMLVVHMRRHTGEKPHRCTFEGCSKAYSRLENLKTHLRSHTGEKPYTCEFPGCTKAFSNASDRAKHQNRTHSNEKPYVCKAPGCTKRYTDPSSLRKHVKTVHGHEFYANKKHKGVDHCNGNENQNGPDNGSKDGDTSANDNSPRSDDGSAAKITGSLSSPSIKSEDTSSPPQQQHSPSGMESNMVNGFSIPDRVDFLDNPISDNNISTTNAVDIIEESEWELAEADELDIPEAAMAAAVIGGALSGSNSNFVQDRNSRNRIKNNLQSKSRMPHLPPLRPFSGVLRRNGNNNSNSGIQNPQTDIKPLSGGQVPKKNVDNNNYSNMSRQNNGNRRDSATSTISSFYSSMRSDNSPHPFGSQTSSRRCSDISHSSNTRLGTLSSPYDPISPGSSRKSSNISNYQEISASMTAHLQRLHRKAIEKQQQENANTANLVTQTQKMSIDNGKSTRLPKISSAQDRHTSLSCKTPIPHDVPNKESRRASDPVRPLDRNVCGNSRSNRQNSQSYNNFNRSTVLPPLNKSPNHQEHGQHPNGDVFLEELDENEPIEANQNLIFPDEMMRFLNQVAEHPEHESGGPTSEPNRPVSSVSQYADATTNQECSPHSNHSSNGQNNQMLSPTYTTLQPVRTSKPPVHQQQPVDNRGQSRQFYNQNNQTLYQNQLNVPQSNIQQPVNSQMYQNNSQPVNNIQRQQQLVPSMPHQNCQPVQQRNYSTPNANMVPQVQTHLQMAPQQFSQNLENVPPSHQHYQYGTTNDTSFQNRVQSNHGMNCGHSANNYGNNQMLSNQNWNVVNNNPGNYCSPQNYNTDFSHPVRVNNSVNSNYQNSTGEKMYNHQCNYVPNRQNNHMCNSCGSCSMNQYNANQPMNHPNMTPSKQHMSQTNQMQQPSSGEYPTQSPYQQNVMANYCMVQQSQQQPPTPYFDSRCSSVPGTTMMPNDTKVCDANYVLNPQTQQSVVPPPSQTCHNHRQMSQNSQAEIQCNDISQSCRAANKMINERTETYQRTLEYVKQCQQVSNKSGDIPQSGIVKKPTRKGSASFVMSPGCKEVTSTTDTDKNNVNYGGEPLETIPRMSTLDEVLQDPPLSISPSTLLNLPNCRDDEDDVSCLNTPCMESLKSVSHTPVMSTNNMVINDMNSSLAFYAEETKYLHSVKH